MKKTSLRSTLRAVAGRIKLCRFTDRLARGIMLGLIPAAVHLALAKTGLLYKWHWDVWPAWASFVPIAVGALAGAVWGLWGRVTDFEAAHSADTALGLKERLGSAVALANDPPNSPGVLDALLKDATDKCSLVRPRDVAGPLLPKRSLLVPVLGCSLLGLWLMPQYHLFSTPEDMVERGSIEQQGQNLLDLAREVERNTQFANLGRADEIVHEVELLGQNLSRGRMGKREAMKELAELTDEVRAEHARIAQKREVQTFREAAAESASQSFNNSRVSDIMNTLADGDVDAARQKLESLKEQVESGDMSAEGMQGLAEDLESVAQSLEGTSAQDAAEALENAAESMRNGDAGEASEQLQEAAQDIADNAGAQGMTEMEQLEALAREMEFAEDQIAKEHIEQPGGG